MRNERRLAPGCFGGVVAFLDRNRDRARFLCPLLWGRGGVCLGGGQSRLGGRMSNGRHRLRSERLATWKWPVAVGSGSRQGRRHVSSHFGWLWTEVEQ